MIEEGTLKWVSALIADFNVRNGVFEGLPEYLHPQGDFLLKQTHVASHILMDKQALIVPIAAVDEYVVHES
jgi:hypothetical protein